METSPMEKLTMTIPEAAKFSGVGQKKLRELSASEECEWVLWVGRRVLVKTEPFKEYLMKQYSI